MTGRRAVSLLVALAVACCACGEDGAADTGRVVEPGGSVVVLGDSVMAWNAASDQDVGARLAAELARPVRNLAVSGARVLGEGGIPSQHDAAGDHTWVVLQGGFNDLGGACIGPRGAAVLEELAGPEGRGGELVDTAEQLAAAGREVVLVGYHRGPSGSVLRLCDDEAAVLAERLAAAAERVDGVAFVDLADVFDPDDASLYDPDRVHPSATGSALVAESLAATIRAAEQR